VNYKKGGIENTTHAQWALWLLLSCRISLAGGGFVPSAQSPCTI